MPRGNVNNLLKGEELTSEKHREDCRKAGIASGEAKRKKRNMQELARLMLDAELLKDDTARAELEARGFEPTEVSKILLAQMGRAGKGDTEAARFLRDTSGQKPVENVAIGNIGDKPFDSLELSQLSETQLRELMEQREG